MSNQKVTMRQIASDTGVPYSTIRSWSKSRPELIDLLIMAASHDYLVESLNNEIDRLKDKLNDAIECLRDES